MRWIAPFLYDRPKPELDDTGAIFGACFLAVQAVVTALGIWKAAELIARLF
jgi:hypothetical protein